MPCPARIAAVRELRVARVLHVEVVDVVAKQVRVLDVLGAVPVPCAHSVLDGALLTARLREAVLDVARAVE